MEDDLTSLLTNRKAIFENAPLMRQLYKPRAGRVDVTDWGVPVTAPSWMEAAQRVAQNLATALPVPGYGIAPDASRQEQSAAVANAAQNLAMGMGPGIVAPEVAATLNTARTLPTNETFAAAEGKYAWRKRFRSDGLRMALQRNQLPEQGLEPSVRGGVFYLPQGAAQGKHYGTGKSGYGGEEKITGETVINNPMFVKGATGGKAPEAAFDSLLGKGKYQEMRNDALRVRHEDMVQKLNGAMSPEDFLAKYAPELKGQGSYIFSKSRQGNQLAYALQEAAVASAARKAGDDAVLGYSVSRKTKQPFVSEVFDVREMNYPDKFGTATDIWGSFKKK